MEYKVHAVSFFKVGGHYEYVTEDKRIVSLSVEMYECFKRQYLQMGYQLFWENDCFVSFSKVLNEIEVFSEKIQKKG